MSNAPNNTTLPSDTSGAEATSGLANNVSVFMPFNLTMDDLTAELFGKAVDLSGTIIKVMREIPLDIMYNSAGSGWLHYIQKEDEDSFEGYVNVGHATNVIKEVKDSLYLVPGETYDPTNNGTENLDASGVFPSVDSKWQNYFSIQDTVLAMFAFKILGHPGALSIISNDGSLRQEISAKFNDALQAMLGADDRAFSTPVTYEDLATLAGDGVTGGLSGSDLNIILQQFMNQAPERFSTVGDRGTLQPLIWKAGDKFYIQMKLSNNSYQLTTQTAGDHPVLMNVNYSNTVTPVNNPGRPLEDGYYVLEFTVGDGTGGGDGGAGGGGGGGGGGGTTVTGFKNFGEWGSIPAGQTGMYSTYMDAVGEEFTLYLSKTINGVSTATTLGFTSGGSGTSSGTLMLGTTAIVSGFDWADGGAEFSIVMFGNNGQTARIAAAQAARAAFNSLTVGATYAASIV